MTQIGLNVPPGFVITTEACLAYLDDPRPRPARRRDGGQGPYPTGRSGDATGKGFGGRDNPLLVSVRSGSAMSMPGMMDTILNLGLNTRHPARPDRPDRATSVSATTPTAASSSCSARWPWACPKKIRRRIRTLVKAKAGVKHDVGLVRPRPGRDRRALPRSGARSTPASPSPPIPYEQLEIAIKAVFNSWGGKRAVDYRREFKITPAMANGTAVNVVAMVFGNMGDDSATGVGFTRDPGTGENVMFGEYLTNAQGEDVVAGIRTPKPVAATGKGDARPVPATGEDLRDQLETHYKEVQDYEYTIEKGVLYCLQTRNGKMNARPWCAPRWKWSMRPHRQDPGPHAHPAGDAGTTAVPPPRPEGQAPCPWPRACPPRRAPPPASPCSTPTGPSSWAALARRSSWCGRRPSRRTSTASSPRRASSPAGAARPATPPWWRAAWASPASPARRASMWTCALRQAIVGDKAFGEGTMITIDGTTGNVYLGEVP
jgi:pyruvate,orthophosphate dikinase